MIYTDDILSVDIPSGLCLMASMPYELPFFRFAFFCFSIIIIIIIIMHTTRQMEAFGWAHD